METEFIDRLEKIRVKWRDRVLQQLAPGKLVRESFADLLDIFFDLLITTIKTNDSKPLEALLDNWVKDQTEQNDQMGSIPSD
jgi:hypothetical protein